MSDVSFNFNLHKKDLKKACKHCRHHHDIFYPLVKKTEASFLNIYFFILLFVFLSKNVFKFRVRIELSMDAAVGQFSTTKIKSHFVSRQVVNYTIHLVWSQSLVDLEECLIAVPE